MWRIRILAVSLGLLGWALSCASESTVSKPPADPQQEATPTRAGRPFAVIETDHGNMTIELLPDRAPQTVERFIELAELGVYDRTLFHRVLKDRMIQGGDPLSRDQDPYNDGQGTAGDYLPQEFSDLPFDRGTVAFGREAGSDNGGSCQFFIVLRRTPEWDGQYNAFGRVVEGIEVAETISRVPLTADPHPLMKNRPAGKQFINKVRIEYRP